MIVSDREVALFGEFHSEGIDDSQRNSMFIYQVRDTLY